MLFTHLNKLKFTVHVFDGLDDERWLDYYLNHKVFNSLEFDRESYGVGSLCFS